MFIHLRARTHLFWKKLCKQWLLIHELFTQRELRTYSTVVVSTSPRLQHYHLLWKTLSNGHNGFWLHFSSSLRDTLEVCLCSNNSASVLNAERRKPFDSPCFTSKWPSLNAEHLFSGVQYVFIKEEAWLCTREINWMTKRV